MGQKDLSEKILLDYNDIFSDIINVLLFHGKQTVRQESLSNAIVHSQYKADDSVLHEEERDCFKYWMEHKIRFAMLGIENQTKVSVPMPLRVIGYDGAAYRMQLLHNKDQKNTVIAPVITIILYFGTDHRWNGARSLKQLLSIPEELDTYVNDYRIHVFEVAWFDEETVAQFKSDFRVVANFFVNKRKNKNYIPTDETEMKHVDEVLKLLSVMTGDDRYTSLLITRKDGAIKTMCDVAERLENKGISKGEYFKLISQIQKKIQKQKLLEQIADELEESADRIRPLYTLIGENPGKSEQDIYDLFCSK